jgi:S1/P1 Nuclease
LRQSRRKTNLHAAWDTLLVERRYGGQNEMTVAKRLVQQYAAHATAWQAGRIDLAAIQAWIEESNHLAKEVAYGQLPSFACGADLEQTRITLSDDYLRRAEPVVEEQLAKAGYRLAYIPNRALGD